MDVTFFSLEQLRTGLRELDYSMPLIILSKSGAERWGIEDFLTEEHNCKRLLWYSSPEINPTQVTVFDLINELRSQPIDGIVAIGGGSVIDLAKGYSALNEMPGIDSPSSLLNAIIQKSYMGNSGNALPIIAVPTTAGTGSEVTQWATIWDADGAAKHSIDARWLKPVEAWIVPQLLSTLPRKLMLATGLDAACHAAEAYWAKASNPLSKALSIRSLQIMTANLKTGLWYPDDEALLVNLSTASLLAGQAFSMTRTTACHSISYPLTYMFGMEHGFAAAVTLAEVARVNEKACDITELLEVFAPFDGIQAWLDYVCEGIVSLRLSAFGISAKDIGAIVDNAFTAGRMDNNPAALTAQAVTAMLMNV